MIVIIGGSFGGLFAARVLARKGIPVTIIEADERGDSDDLDRAFDEWNRPGVPQLRQPHSIRAQARKKLLDDDPELAADLLNCGAIQWKYKLVRPGMDILQDDDLIGLLARRTTFEPVVRARVEQTPGVTFVRAAVGGLIIEGADRPRVVGVRLRDGQELRFDAVVDASGRRTRIPDWLRQAGIEPPTEVSQEAGMIYYSRYFRFRPGAVAPQAQGIRSGPSGNLPLVSFRSNTTDRNTFSMLIAVASWEQDFRALKDEGVFNAFAASLPGVAPWIDSKVSDPICKVHAFGGIYDRHWEFLRDGRPIIGNLYSVGDARVHTSPYFGWGITLTLNHAYQLAKHYAGPDNEAAQIAFEKEAGQFSYHYYEAAAGEDAARTAMWQGQEPADPDRYGFYVKYLQAATQRDPYVYRAVYRRINLLDDANAIFADRDIIERASRAMQDGAAKTLSASEVLANLDAAKGAMRRPVAAAV